MGLKIFQKGFNYSQDGRGNRLIYHLQGCNMRCPWCSNPEGMPAEGVLITERDWLFPSCCPKGAVRDAKLDRSLCASCADRPCIHGRQKGIRLSCRTVAVEELVEECLRSRPMFFDGGGVTLTGGEITVQFEAVKEFLTAAGAEGIHRAVETNGSHPEMEQYLPLVEEWIMDIKHWDGQKHKEWLGVSNTQVLKNIRMAVENHPDVLLRIPLIPGFNDSREDAEKFAEFFGSCRMGENVRLELLTYHEFGKEKWGRCGWEYAMKPGKIARETYAYFEKTFRDEGIKLVRT